MHRIDLDYMPRSGTARWLGFGLLALAALAGAKQLDTFITAKQEVARMEARISRIASRSEHASVVALPDSTIREIRRANDVIEQIALPWDRLFRAVESAAGEKVALLGITPDQKSGTVEVAGEAADLGAMFDYVKRLQRQPSLARVYLLNQKLNDQDAQRPVRFTVTASWLEKKSGS
jgi:Tfp pilus assembly protein PilN